MPDNWMFGGVSNPDLSDPNPKKTYFDRSLPAGYTEGGLGIGEGGKLGRDSDRKAAQAAAYRAQLEKDAATHGASDQLPDCKKRSAYDFSSKTPVNSDHPLGQSNLSALGESTLSQMDQAKLARAQQKREELSLNRFDIISCLETSADPKNSPRARNAAELLVGMPIPGRNDDGILLIGRTAGQEEQDRKKKQMAYMAQLNADTGVKFGLDENYDPKKDSLSTYKSHARIEHTGQTGYHISSGASLDMSQSMKELDRDAKLKAQAAYREVLMKQQEDRAVYEATQRAIDRADHGDQLPYMSK